MDLIKTYAEEITSQLNGVIDLEEVVKLIEKPKYAEQGDLAFPCFSLAKMLRKSPHSYCRGTSRENPKPSL